MEPLIAGPLDAQCGKCLYWEQNENVATMGECRRYPPQVVMVREAGDAQNTASSEWPLRSPRHGAANGSTKSTACHKLLATEHSRKAPRPLRDVRIRETNFRRARAENR